MGDKPGPIRNLATPDRRPRSTTITDGPTGTRPTSLLAVDEMVERIYDAVEASGELEEHRHRVHLATTATSTASTASRRGKSKVYEEAVRVPLLVVGPGFPARTVTDPVINADLAPTFVELAGATPRRVMDGRSLLHRLAARPLLFEAANVAAPYTAVHAGRWLWVEYASGERELYDMVNDRYQLQSRHAASCAGRCARRARPAAGPAPHLQGRGRLPLTHRKKIIYKRMIHA